MALDGGKKASMGVRKAVKAAASSTSQWYFSVSTSFSPLYERKRRRRRRRGGLKNIRSI